MQHPVAHAVSLAAVAGIFHQPQRRIFRGKTSNNLCRVVAGPVVDDDDLGVPSLLVNVAQHFFQRRAESRALVVRRNHDAVGGVQRQFSILGSQFSVGTEVCKLVSSGSPIVRCAFGISEIGIQGVPQGLKPIPVWRFTVRLKPYPSTNPPRSEKWALRSENKAQRNRH